VRREVVEAITGLAATGRSITLIPNVGAFWPGRQNIDEKNVAGARSFQQGVATHSSSAWTTNRRRIALPHWHDRLTTRWFGTTVVRVAPIIH
jgi:hypothetical protein